MGNKKKIAIVGGIILTMLLIIGTIVFFVGKNNNNDNIIIKDNVNVITSETDIQYQPIQVTDNTIVFQENPKYKFGDVIVAGMIDAAPHGFIRKVIEVKNENGMYIYETEYAVLTEVFEEAHIIRYFALTQDGAHDMEDPDNTNMTVNVEMKNDSNSYGIMPLSYQATNNRGDLIQLFSVIPLSKSDRNMLFSMELEEIPLSDTVSIGGEIGFDAWIEVKIDIEDGEIDFGIATHTKASGELFLGCSGEAFDKEKDEGEYSKDLYEKELANFQFYIGYVPVVITNNFKATVDASVQLEGSIGTTVSVESDRVTGFEYSSQTGKIQEINEKTYLGDGIDWTTAAQASGTAEAGVYAHLITKLYGCTGADLSVGIMGNVNGEISASVNQTGENKTYGALDFKVGPKANGSVVVSVPVIDKKLTDAPLFTITLPMFIEESWSAEAPIVKGSDATLSALLRGDFSEFAGSYRATSEDYDGYGGGHKLNNLQLNEDGSITGGGSYYSEVFYPSSKPISVTKNEDGSYLCKLTENSHFLIYPIGAIEDNQYVREHQKYLKDIVYINCFVFDGGVLDVTYYLDVDTNEGTISAIANYDGVDWVALDSFNSEIGSSFVSGTGIKYTVVDEEHNDESGRIKVVLTTEAGSKRVVGNIPAFLLDEDTGITYYNIYEY